MIWLATITAFLLIAKVVLATLLPAARRREQLEAQSAGAPPIDENWLNLTNLHRCQAARISVRSDHLLRP